MPKNQMTEKYKRKIDIGRWIAGGADLGAICRVQYADSAPNVWSEIGILNDERMIKVCEDLSITKIQLTITK